MFARSRTLLAIAFPAVLVPGLAACDLSQKKPETSSTLVVKHVGDSPSAVAVQAPAAQSAAAPAATERSVRLYGPGVSRDRQTRL